MEMVEKNTRAACYMKARKGMARHINGPEGAANAAWDYAGNHIKTIATRQAEWRKARADLATLWEGLGKREPKQFAADGEALCAARDLERETLRNLSAVWAHEPSASKPYAGTWQSGPGMYFCENPETYFRDVQIAHECANLDSQGYYDNPFSDCSGLVVGVVAQLPGRNGQARYVAGYRMGNECGEGATFDLSKIYESPGVDLLEAQREAARAADSMAESVAETERDYQAAWQAGSRWASLGWAIGKTRERLLDVLKERRAARDIFGPDKFANLCAAIRAQISTGLDDIREARGEREELALGDVESLWWNPGDAAQLSGFAEGAELTLEQARAVCP